MAMLNIGAASLGLETQSNNDGFVVRHYAKTQDGLITLTDFVANILAHKYPKNFPNSLDKLVGVAPTYQEYEGTPTYGIAIKFAHKDGRESIYTITAASGVEREDVASKPGRASLLVGAKLEKAGTENSPLAFKLYKSNTFGEFETEL